MTNEGTPQDDQSILVQIMSVYCVCHRGSVASERLQHHIWVRFPDLYRAVVGRRGRWHKFVQRFPHTFQLLSPEHTCSKTWRVRLIKGPADWQRIDSEEYANSERYKRDLVHKTLGLMHERQVSHLYLRDILCIICPDMRPVNLAKILRRSALLGVAHGHVYLLRDHFS